MYVSLKVSFDVYFEVSFDVSFQVSFDLSLQVSLDVSSNVSLRFSFVGPPPDAENGGKTASAVIWH